jgi:hypothetical protein
MSPSCENDAPTSPRAITTITTTNDVMKPGFVAIAAIASGTSDVGVRRRSPAPGRILDPMRAAEIDREIDRLYQLPLDEFTAARNALATQAGPDAGDIRKLQKPPLAAWVVNQVYWRHRAEYDALVEAASEVRAAHKAVLSGKRVDLRRADKDHEEAMERALKAALAVLQGSGHPVTEQTRHAIATTLRGLPADEPPGRLARVLRPGGFEMLAGISVRPPPPAKSRSTPVKEDRRGARPDQEAGRLTAAESRTLERAKEAAATAARDAKVAEQAARREEFEAARAAREAEKSTRAVQTARDELEAAQRLLDEAERAAVAAERRREAADRRVREADAELFAARSRLAEAEAQVNELSRGRKH